MYRGFYDIVEKNTALLHSLATNEAKVVEMQDKIADLTDRNAVLEKQEKQHNDSVAQVQKSG